MSIPVHSCAHLLNRQHTAVVMAMFLLPALCFTSPAMAQEQTGGGQNPTLGTLRLPTVFVVATKEPAELERVPVSVTAVTGDTIASAGITSVSEAAMFAPNTFYSDLSARKVSNARFRGIGSSPANPGISTFIDGVPQLNTNTSSLELLDVEQIEFVRGAGSALFGRNTLGGVVNVSSRLPALDGWTGRIAAPFGSFADRGFQASVSGPVSNDSLGVSASFAYTGRDGFTVNSLTGNSLDDRSSYAGKAQLFWKSRGPWQARLIVSGEHDRDGDYSLADLGGVRSGPFEVARDFEGRTDRDVVSATFIARREGARVTFASVTGLVDWNTQDLTDLDYTPAPLVRRDNREDARQFTQEVRVSSSAAAPLRVSGSATLAWQAGLFVFTQDYQQDAVNSYAPFLLSPDLGFAVDQNTPSSVLDDSGVGVFGNATLTLRERFDVVAGVRVDREQRTASLNSFYTPAIAPPTVVDGDRSFSSVSPQLAVAYRVVPDSTIYASVGRGFKAGGFNPASPDGSEVYGEEQAWHLEGGMRASLAGGRVRASAAVFSIDWQDMQLNLPDPFVPAQFYIANVGGARSSGVEAELHARVHDHLSVFGAVGYTRASFDAGSVSSGVDVSGNRLPGTPEYTGLLGVEISHPTGGRVSLYGRADAAMYGSFHYDDLNQAGQDAYALTNLRAGVRGSRLFVEGWVRNVFDTRYVPVAFAYDPNLAPSGFLGEPGRPRTFGVSVGVEF